MPRPKYTDRQIQEAIARRVQQARKRKGWTQERFAEELDVASETVSKYENGKLPLSVTMLYRVADILEVEVEVLLGKGPAGLREEEKELLERWRGLDRKGQEAVLEVVRRMSH